MFGNSYYFGLIRKYVIYFGTLFNDISIDRVDANGVVVQTIKVPLTYAPKDKMLARIEADPNLNREYAVNLPIMSFKISNLRYDSDRHRNTLNRMTRLHNSDARLNKYNYSPAPFDFNFSLYIYVKNTEDGTRIVEQILPYFQPDFMATLRLIPELDINVDVPVIHLSTDTSDDYTGDFTQRRSIIWTMEFLMKGELHQPIKVKPIINFVNTAIQIPNPGISITDAVGNSVIDGTIKTYPGLDANGNPTSNASLSISKDEIFADDDFGFYTIGTIGDIQNE